MRNHGMTFLKHLANRRIRFAKRTLITLLVFSVVAFALLAAGLPANAQGGTVVKVDPSSSTVAVGATIVVNVRIENVTNLAGAEVHITYDPTLLEVQGIAAGGFLAPDFVAQSSATGGHIDYAIAQMPAQHQPVSGSGVFLQMTFKGLANGTSPINFTSAVLSDAGGNPIAQTTQNGSVIVGTAPAATATPTLTPTATGTPIPGATATPIVAPTATPAGYQILGNHTVKAGESLYCIARAYRVSPWAIASQNNVAWPYTIYPGQVLAIPNVTWYNIPPGPTCAPQFGTGPTPTPSATCSAYYIIQWGDTLLGIARRYNVNVYTLASVNHIYNLNLIYAGSTLCIP